LTSWKLPEYINTLAAAYSEVGENEKACELQVKAIKLSKDSKQIEEMRQRLRSYRSGLPYRRDP
jgi:hypothetical protein